MMGPIPEAFNCIVGNDDIKKQLMVSIGAAKRRGLPLPHILFAGAAGCGKTTTSKAVAVAMGVPYIPVSPYNLRTGKIIFDEIVSKLPWNGYDNKGNIVGKIIPSIVFIDEIHNIPLKGQEILGLMMENWEFPSSRRKTGNIPRFTLVGATTMEGMLSKPMRDRFKSILRFNTYSLSDSIKIVENYVMTGKGLKISRENAVEIARRSRGVPRLIIRYIDWMSDLLLVSTTGKGDEITGEITSRAFKLMGIDERGLGEVDLKILKCLAESDTPTGLDTLIVISNETSKTIEQVIEPFLIQTGLIKRTPSGRVITEAGRDCLEEKGIVASSRHYIVDDQETEANEEDNDREID